MIDKYGSVDNIIFVFSQVYAEIEPTENENTLRIKEEPLVKCEKI